MKICVRGKISSHVSTKDDSYVTIDVDHLGGAVASPPNVAAKEAKAKLVFCIKPIVAQKLHIGETLYVTIATEDEK